MDRIFLQLLAVLFPVALWAQKPDLVVKIMESEITIGQGECCVNITLQLMNNSEKKLLLYHDFSEGVWGYPFPEVAFCDSLRGGSSLGLFIIDSNGTVLEVQTSFSLPSSKIRRKMKREIKRKNKENEKFVMEELSKEENRGKNLSPEYLLVQRDIRKNRLLISSGGHKENTMVVYLNNYFLRKGAYSFYLHLNVGPSPLNMLNQEDSNSKQIAIFQGCAKSNRIKLIVK